jgi:hypothetical protein
VKAISEFVGADYSAKYSVSSFIEYNTEQYVPLTSRTSMEGKGQTRDDKKYFVKSKGYGGKRFSQAVFGFKKSPTPSAKLRKGGSRVNSHLFPLFAITTGWAGKDEMTCILRFWQRDARGLMKPPDVLKSLVENLKADNGKAIPLDPEDKNGYSESIKFLAGLVKMEVIRECLGGGGGRSSRTGFRPGDSGRRQDPLGFDRQEDGSGTGGAQWK